MVTNDYFDKAQEQGMDMDKIIAIVDDFKKKSVSYEQDAQYVANVLLKASGVHSVRYRIKEQDHLFDKIVRKKIGNSERVIELDNYEQEITDLAGVRVLHLFKSDWKRIHDFITRTWSLKESPTAYYRQGDSAEILEMFSKHECEVKQHPAGYRSVHYLIETSPTKAKRYVEIQVRTIFEEGWSEVDHKIRYPNLSDNNLTNNLLQILNRLAGNADEMSSFVQELNFYIINSDRELERTKKEKDEQIKKLEEIIEHLNISKKEKAKLEEAAKAVSATATGLNSSFLKALEVLSAPNHGLAEASKRMATALGSYPNLPDISKKFIPGQEALDISSIASKMAAGLPNISFPPGIPNLPTVPPLPKITGLPSDL